MITKALYIAFILACVYSVVACAPDCSKTDSYNPVCKQNDDMEYLAYCSKPHSNECLKYWSDAE